MSKKEIEQAIIDIVNECQGEKATIVAALAVDRCAKLIEKSEDVIDAINHLVERHEICEIEYILTGMGYRIKSFLLPAGSIVTQVHAKIRHIK